ncbi:MBL fold metallo-hydrolase [Corynebacterium sp. H128]|uniref:MBL fold metallo-hydrolase n=1 Tax=Corynebacterium sp. H128 TaxID=3133427 RepID=UPI0030A3F2E4
MAPSQDGMSAAEQNMKETAQVAPRFGEEPQVVSDPKKSGAPVAQLIFEKSEVAVVSGPEVAAQARAASISVVAHAPMLISTPETQQDVVAALGELGVHTVLMVGDATPVEQPGLSIIPDPGTKEALGDLTAVQFEERPAEHLLSDVAGLDLDHPVLLNVPGEELAPRDITAPKGFPMQSTQDGGTAPPVLAGPETSVAAVASARAFGAPVKVLDYADPRFNAESKAATVGLADKPVLALGDEFGTSAELKSRIEAAQTQAEQPGGGGLVFPGRHVVALYGHPSGPALGVMGEQPPAEAAAEVQRRVAQYQEHTADPVVPAFEIIATVASGGPGADGDFSNESKPEELAPYIDAITAAGGYAILDLQPGRASFLDQAKRYEELLKRPNVGLALDPEWKLYGEQRPMQEVGHVEIAEVNEVSEWLAQLTRDNDLPQKPFVLHQFQLQMIRDRENMQFHDELATVLHVDGHGSEGDKLATWEAVKQDLDPRVFLAWKNFHDEDTPMFDTQRTMGVSPRPWLVTYQ